MKNNNSYDVIIIGGSYSGLSAAMSLGRALRNILILDNGNPCNLQTPYSHNFITQDGETPANISAKARLQVEQYPTVQFMKDLAIKIIPTAKGFEVTTSSSEVLAGRKVLFATGVKDLFPEISGFESCWGISVLHCPYCHGYEVKNEKTAILANGEMAFEYAKLISNWTKDLHLCTNGSSELTSEQTQILQNHGVSITEQEIDYFEHNSGYISKIVFKNQEKMEVKAVYARIPFVQHCFLPAELGCEITESGYLKVDLMQRTTVPGIYASGDATTQMRSVALAVSSGTTAGAAINKELINEDF
jgi:thioredoxin reductase